MNSLLEYLPLLNLLVLPVFGAYVKNEVRLTRLEDHRARVDHAMGWHEPKAGA